MPERGRRRAEVRAAPEQYVPKVLLGRYEVLEELGHGGMGAVYRARDRQLGRNVAIKLVRARKELSEMLTARLLREAQALAQLSHPNVVAVYDVGEAEGSVFIVMELVAGIAGDAWVREPHPWREVLRVFRDAGRGLAAAHAVGLVHRDFKPANLILGDDGRVRVLDFGLARTTSSAQMGSDPALPVSSGDEDDTEITDPPPNVSTSLPAASLLESPLTQAGVIVGTPPYMAPEQHLGGASDARSDQFGFCVSFYRALYGQRPFGGNTYGEVKANILAGKLRPPPAGADVPGWLREIVLRGLAKEPQQRWPSMDALLDGLGRDPDAKRRKLLLAAGAAALIAGAGAMTWHARRDPADACRSDAHELAGVWDGQRKDAVRAAFAKSSKPFATAALGTVTRTLDGYTNHWLAMRTDACMATRVHGTQSAELLDLRMECLQRRLDDVRALVGVLASADNDLIARATDITGGLPPLASCADADALRAPVRPPADPKLAQRVEVARRTLATARALSNAGRYSDAKKELAPVLTEAQAIGWRPLEGEALLVEARLADSTGDYPAAAKQFKEAATAAEAGRDDETAALARNGLVWVTGERLGHYAEAQELAVDAAAKVERLGHSELIQADLDQKMSALFFEQGNLEEAEKRTRRVLAIRQKVLGNDDPGVASALGDLGDIAVQTARYDDAIDDYRRALAIAEKTVGPDHSLCGTLRGNLGNALSAKGKPTEALAELEHARDITERSLGPDHVQLGTIAINIGNTLVDQGRTAEAAAQFAKASEIWTRALGPDHPNVATALFRGGEVALSQGHAAEATTAFQRALQIWQAKLGAEHPSLAAAYIGLGDAALSQKHAAVALGHYQRALALLEKAFGSSHPELVDVLVSVGKSELEAGSSRPARASLDRALAIVETGTDPVEQARGRLSVARALVSIDPARAMTLATAAQDAFSHAGPDHAHDAEEAATWLRDQKSSKRSAGK